MYICIYVYRYICSYMYVYIYICIYLYMYIFIYVYLYMYICIYVYIQIYTYIYVYIYIYIYIYARVRASRGLKFYRVWWVWDWDSELLIRILKPKLGRVSNRQKSCSRFRLPAIYDFETQGGRRAVSLKAFRNHPFHGVILNIWHWDRLETESQTW